ncbi:MAG TPA: hypothetical protein VHN78_16795, partial [Chloroflexota bacterium]|nr:hypothetical protein [Chloroflexota bacterium]
MGVKHLTCAAVVVASALLVAAPVMAIELGELQAVPSGQASYVFRLAIAASPHAADPPAVTVHRPQDAISVVTPNRLELRLRSLTDVELEVSHGGQTLNRLLLRSELQAARAHLDAATAWKRYQVAKARGAPRPQLTALLDSAYHAHQTWGQFDPVAARQPLAQVEQERLRVPTAGGRQPELDAPEAASREPPVAAITRPAATTAGSLDGAGLERELQALREEMHHLAGRATASLGGGPPPAHPAPQVAPPLLTLLLGGVVLVGVTSLCTGYVLQRRAVERQRRRWPVAAVPRPQFSGAEPQAWRRVTVMRRVRVSRQTRRRVR